MSIIIVSAVSNPLGIILFLLFNASDKIDFVVPQFIIEEIELHQSKIIKAATITRPKFQLLFTAIKENLLIFSDDLIDE